MKRILYLALIAGLITGCSEKKHSGFVVSGVIENAPGKKVLLIETPSAISQPVVLDSTFLNDKGSFTLKGRANE